VSWITARRRHRASGYAVVLLGLAGIGVTYASFTSTGSPASAADPGVASQSVAEGKYLFSQSCSSCHGIDAQGTSAAPSLIGAGAAAVDFQMSTGRMPAKEQGAEMDRKPQQQFTQQQIYDIASYIASLGGGPSIPSDSQVSSSGANIGLGQQLYAANCAACHNIAGAGGALTNGKYAPSLNEATPRQIYEAMQTGPEAMPVFGDGAITPSEKRDIIAYITSTQKQDNPGGLSLGRVGPVTEGLVGWIGGVGLLVFVAMWITAKRRNGRREES
jgi:ubiquinol-cytochrome c reductase cytochrome c subunit